MHISRFLIISLTALLPASAPAADDNDMDAQIKRGLSALEKRPDDMEALRGLSMTYLNKADFNNAMKYGKRLQQVAYSKQDYNRYVIYSHVIMGEAFTMKGDKEQAYNNLGQAEQNARAAKNDSVTCSVCNALAIYYVNMQNDTYRALTYLFRGLDAAKRCKNTKMYNILLSNIAETYYLRQDTTGLKYALECHEIGRRTANDVLTFHSGISAAYLYCLKGNLAEADRYIQRSAVLMENRGFHDRAQVFNIRGMIAFKSGKAQEAASWYRRSISEQADGSVPNTVCAYLGYGLAAAEQGHLNEAIDSLKRGTTLARRGNSNRYLPKLLLAISECEQRRGNTAAALSYYKQFHASKDTLFNAEKELAVGDIRAKYDMARHENQLKQQQIDLMQTRNRMLLMVALLFIMAVAATLLYILYRRKNILYKAIVQQNQAAIKREQTLREELSECRSHVKYASSSLSDDRKQTLFARLEALMDEQKPYRDRLLTKEKVAEMLGTNRTYLSQAINEQTGQTFTSYIGTLRTKEAIRLISDPLNTTPLKAVCQDVGFSSMTTFYSQFQQTTGMTPATYRSKVIEMN